MSYETPEYSRVNIEVLKASKPTYWYANLVGETIEVEKQKFDNSVSYRSLKEEAAYFFEEDIIEVPK